MIRLWLLGGGLVVLTLAALSLHVPGALGIGSIELKTRFVEISAISLAVYLAAVWMVTHRLGSPRGVWVVLAVAAVLRLPLIVSPSFLSNDVNRYVWDGRVQAAGINPYQYLPVDPALASLRDKAVYPLINRADYAKTIYAPTAELVFAAVGFVWPSALGVKAAVVGFEGLAIFCLLRLLAAARMPAERVLIYAWNPLPLWDFAGSGHVDAVSIGLIAAALLLRVRRQDGWAGVMLGLAVLVKFLPAVIAPVLWRQRSGWRMAGAAAVTVVALYGIYSSVGWGVFGFLQGYGDEEGYASGEGFWLLAGLSRLVPLTPAMAVIYKACVMSLLAALGVWFAFVRRPEGPVAVCAAAGVMMAALTFALSPHYPWYFGWLAVPAVLSPMPVLIWLSAAPILMYLDTFGDRFIWPSVVYIPAVLLAAGGLLRPPRVALVKGTI